MCSKKIVGILGILGIVIVVPIIFMFIPRNVNADLNQNLNDYMVNIPEKPEDFNIIVRDIQSHYMDLSKLNESYYLQPELYAGSWKIGKRFYDNHDYSRWGVHGHGAYPSNPIILMGDNVDSWILFSTFYRTGWNIETWQGVKLQPQSSEYFDVNITPNEFLLEPTFPVFERGWARPININVSIKEKPPIGSYEIAINAVNPSESNAKKWFWDVLKQNLTLEEDKLMVVECENQLSMSEKCQEWIGARRNKYVDSGFIQVGPRLTLKIIIVNNTE